MAVAREGFTALPSPFQLALTDLSEGWLLRRGGRKHLGRESLDRAALAFDALGARLWADLARVERAKIGGRRPSAGTLTEAEVRVARLAAAGRTNREIAETLTISVRTVEGHLSVVYGKIRIRSRTELALFLQEEGEFPSEAHDHV
jgi:DNA-binding NarL/FixJ family response regulator